MSENYDQFGDVIQGVAGIFGAETAAMDNGLSDFDKAGTHADEKGVHISMRCRGCGRPKVITAEWPEIFCLAKGVSPHNCINGMTPWSYSQIGRGWYPMVACENCQTPLVPLVPMQEAQQHLLTGNQHKWPWFRSQAPAQLNQIVTQVLASQQRG
jgi:hypothetical protein